MFVFFRGSKSEYIKSLNCYTMNKTNKDENYTKTWFNLILLVAQTDYQRTRRHGNFHIRDNGM